jgi:hypothetical protein
MEDRTMTNTYAVEYTDTFGGEANYGWVRRADISVPEWTAFKDWDGNGRREPKGYRRAVMRRAKAAVGLTGVRGVTHDMGDGYEFRPYSMCTVMFVSWRDV